MGVFADPRGYSRADRGRKLLEMRKKNPGAFDDNFGMNTSKQRYVEGRPGNVLNPFQNAKHFDSHNYEWQRKLRLPDGKSSKSTMRCPEDARPGPKRKHAAHVFFFNCQAPICESCRWRT